jgi:hypothetical protein
MKIIKFRAFLLLELFLLILFLSIALRYVTGRDNRFHLFSYFSTRCLDYRQKEFSRKLNDRIVDYSEAAKRNGIRVCKDEKDIKERISEGHLVKVRSGNRYIVDKMNFSYPYLTQDSKSLLIEIGRRFREKTSLKGLRGSRFFITSMTRLTESQKSLVKYNKNASANSPHIYGNAFDISYKRFSVRKFVLTNCDEKFLKEALAEVIWQLRQERKCWATYEKGQSCFHIVFRSK